jgi:hypothetical protein
MPYTLRPEVVYWQAYLRAASFSSSSSCFQSSTEPETVKAHTSSLDLPVISLWDYTHYNANVPEKTAEE